MLNNKVYNILKKVAQYWLPGAATLYFALAGIWGLPYAEEVVGTIVAVDVFLGAILGLSTVKYNKARKAEGYLGRVPEYEERNRKLAMSNETYDIVKWVVMIVLPASGTLYFALSQLWGFPYGEQIVGTVAAVTAFAGVILGVSTSNYKKSI
jgi:hypothetical protein